MTNNKISLTEKYKISLSDSYISTHKMSLSNKIKRDNEHIVMYQQMVELEKEINNLLPDTFITKEHLHQLSSLSSNMPYDNESILINQIIIKDATEFETIFTENNTLIIAPYKIFNINGLCITIYGDPLYFHIFNKFMNRLICFDYYDVLKKYDANQELINKCDLLIIDKLKNPNIVFDKNISSNSRIAKLLAFI